MNTVWKIFSILSFGLLLYQIFFDNDQFIIDYPEPVINEKPELVCFISEEMPRFPGCEQFYRSKSERQSCANQELMEFVYSNLEYNPNSAHVEGTAVVQFVVKKNGSLSDVKIVKSLSSQLDRAILKMIKKMPKWIPGKQSGQAVAVRFTLPVKIRLE